MSPTRIAVTYLVDFGSRTTNAPRAAWASRASRWRVAGTASRASIFSPAKFASVPSGRPT